MSYVDTVVVGAGIAGIARGGGDAPVAACWSSKSPVGGHVVTTFIDGWPPTPASSSATRRTPTCCARCASSACAPPRTASRCHRCDGVRGFAPHAPAARWGEVTASWRYAGAGRGGGASRLTPFYDGTRSATSSGGRRAAAAERPLHHAGRCASRRTWWRTLTTWVPVSARRRIRRGRASRASRSSTTRARRRSRWCTKSWTSGAMATWVVRSPMRHIACATVIFACGPTEASRG